MLALLSLIVLFGPPPPFGTGHIPKGQVSEVDLIQGNVMEIRELTILSGEKADTDFGQKLDQQFNQRNGSPRQTKEKMVGKKVLNGVKPAQGDSTFIGTLHPMLKAAGSDWSIPGLTGTFGHAFSFSMKTGDGAVWQQANIDWWLLWDMITDIGYEFEEFQIVHKGKQLAPTPKEFQNIKDQTWEKVKASIDRGIPAIAWQPMTVEQRDSYFKNGKLCGRC